MPMEPMTCKPIAIAHIPGLPSMSSAPISPEKAEKVVNEPRKPVMKNNFQYWFKVGNIANTDNAIPIRKLPSQLTARVPGGIAENKGLRARLKSQRHKAPADAPRHIAIAEKNIFLTFRKMKARGRYHAPFLSILDYYSLFYLEFYNIQASN